MVKDISNAYLLTTDDGDLLVNTGFLGNGERNRNLFAPHRTGALRRIILTQAHADHFGAVPELKEPDTQIIAGAGFTETDAYFRRLDAFLKRRSGKLWASLTRRNGPPPHRLSSCLTSRCLIACSSSRVGGVSRSSRFPAGRRCVRL